MSLEFVGGCMGGEKSLLFAPANVSFFHVSYYIAFMIHFAPGAAGVLVGYPFDTAKVRIQTSEAGTYRGTFHCLFVCMR